MFGELVRARRTRVGLTQEELAARTGIGVRTVRDIEAGRVDRPRPGTVRLLADAFGLTGTDRDRFHESAAAAGPAATDPGPAGTGPVRGPDSGRGPAPALDGHVRPAQLPADVAGFTGRTGELRRLTALLDSAEHTPGAVLITAIAGTAGVGKTALAVHWAHHVSDRFPDGQLYVNLRGYDPGWPPTSPADAIGGFLEALQVPVGRIPAGPDARAALYRSLLAGRRMLVVLDNARDADHVRQLLPGTPGCLAVVTSRDQLTGLVTSTAAPLIALDVLATAEARALLAARLGAERVAAEPEAVEEIIDRCARLPLALAVAAARAAIQPRSALAELAAELRAGRDRLDAFAAGDPATDVRAVFSWSYAGLPAPAARLFRLLGLHPGPDVSAAAAASLARRPGAQVRAALADLTRAHLVEEQSPDRYGCHDLLRSYAAELAREQDPAAERSAATGRMLDHYLHSAHAAAVLLQPHRDPVPLPPAGAGVTAEAPPDLDQALRWFAAERRVLVAAVDVAAAAGLDEHVWQLAWTLDNYLDRRGHWTELLDTWQLALRAAQRLADPAAEARAHRSLAHAATRLGRYADAEAQFERALTGYDRLADHTRQAHTHLNLAWLHEELRRPEAALAHIGRALQLYRRAGHRAGESHALNNLGWVHGQLGDHERALAACEQALALAEEIDDRYGQAGAWDSLGSAHHHLGRPEQASSCYRQALRLHREIGDRYEEAATLGRLGDTQQAAGDPAAARQSRELALHILDELGHPDAVALRAILAG